VATYSLSYHLRTHPGEELVNPLEIPEHVFLSLFTLSSFFSAAKRIRKISTQPWKLAEMRGSWRRWDEASARTWASGVGHLDEADGYWILVTGDRSWEVAPPECALQLQERCQLKARLTLAQRQPPEQIFCTSSRRNREARKRGASSGAGAGDADEEVLVKRKLRSQRAGNQ